MAPVKKLGLADRLAATPRAPGVKVAASRRLAPVHRAGQGGKLVRGALGIAACLLWLAACGAGAGGGRYAVSPAQCRRIVDRQVRCGRTPPSQAPLEVERCVEQSDCWPRIVQRPLVPRLLGCMASAPCRVDCFDEVMLGAPMSPAARRLEQACLSRGCGARCSLAGDLAGASDEILDDVAWCFHQRPCDEVEGCATGAVLAQMLRCAPR